MFVELTIDTQMHYVNLSRVTRVVFPGTAAPGAGVLVNLHFDGGQLPVALTLSADEAKRFQSSMGEVLHSHPSQNLGAFRPRSGLLAADDKLR